MNRLLLFVTASALALAPLGCGEGPGNSSSSAPGTAGVASWQLNEPPVDAQSVGQVKAEAEEGQFVTVRGRVGGSVKPISDEAPVFLIVDKQVKHCGQLHEDACPTPWDYCCEPRESLMANSATVQLMDESGQPLAGGLGEDQLKPLDEVVVVGTVGPRPSQEVLTIRATGVHRSPAQ